MDETGADGIAVARGAMYRPWVFAEITGKTDVDKKADIKRQLSETEEVYGEKFACVFMRKMIGFYLRGGADAASLRAKLFACASLSEVCDILEGLNF